MNFNEIFEQTKYAFEHDEVYELLTGKKGYAYHAPMISVAVPSCIEFVFRDGIFPYYNDSNDNVKNDIIYCIKKALSRMIASEDEVEIWWALHTLRCQKDYEEYFKKSPFKIADAFWPDIKNALKSKKAKLMENQSFLGAGCSHGLWDDVKRNHRLLMEDYNISVLEDI